MHLSRHIFSHDAPSSSSKPASKTTPTPTIKALIKSTAPVPTKPTPEKTSTPNPALKSILKPSTSTPTSSSSSTETPQPAATPVPRAPRRHKLTLPHRRLASLLVSFLAISPAGIDFEAPNPETIKVVKKAAQAPPAKLKKAPYRRTANRVKPAEIRRFRFARWRYEMRLKFAGGKSGGKGKGGGREEEGEGRWVELGEM